MRYELNTAFAGRLVIHTEHVCPPIPVRDMDWSAVTDDYDCDCDQDGFYSTHPVGTGATEDEAIQDLLYRIEDAS